MRNGEMTMQEIADSSPEMKILSSCFTDCGIRGIEEKTVGELLGTQTEAMLHAWDTYERQLKSGIPTLLDLYTEEERKESEKNDSVRLLYLRCRREENSDEKKPFVLVFPGGAYLACSTYMEGMLTADLFTERGMDTFVLSYHVNYEGVIEDALSDAARALKKILSLSEQLGIRTEDYIVTGFSAGGHLAATWGTKDAGARAFRLPNPKALFLLYPSLSVEAMKESLAEGFGDEFTREIDTAFLHMLTGDPENPKMRKKYSVEYHVDEAYPACYLLHCKDDPFVTYETSVRFDRALTKQGIRHLFHPLPRGGHGFGAGIGTDAEFWVEEAIGFWAQKE